MHASLGSRKFFGFSEVAPKNTFWDLVDPRFKFKKSEKSKIRREESGRQALLFNPFHLRLCLHCQCVGRITESGECGEKSLCNEEMLGKKNLFYTLAGTIFFQSKPPQLVADKRSGSKVAPASETAQSQRRGAHGKWEDTSFVNTRGAVSLKRKGGQKSSREIKKKGGWKKWN